MNITKMLTERLTYSASTDQELDLPTEGIITRIDLHIFSTMSASSATVSTHGLHRIIDGLKIVGGGGHTYFAMTGVQMGIMLHYVNLIDFPGTTWREWNDTAAFTQNYGYRLHFGSRPRDEYGRDNPFDLTGGIPAEDETNLRLIWTCPANTVCDDTITISTTYMYATVHYVLRANKREIMVPVSISEGYVPGTTKTDLGGERDIPTGSFLRRIVIMCQDHQNYTANAPILMADQVTEMGIILVKDSRRLITTRTMAQEVIQPWFDGGTTVDAPNTSTPFATPGLYHIDMRQFADRDYGMDTRGYNAGEIILGLTVGAYTANDVEYIWYDQLAPYGK